MARITPQEVEKFGIFAVPNRRVRVPKHVERDIIVVGVYVNDLLVAATNSTLVDTFFNQLHDLSVKNLGKELKC